MAVTFIEAGSGRKVTTSEQSYISSQIYRAKKILETGRDPYGGTATYDKIKEDLERFDVDLDKYVQKKTSSSSSSKSGSSKRRYDTSADDELIKMKKERIYGTKEVVKKSQESFLDMTTTKWINTAIAIFVGFLIIKILK